MIRGRVVALVFGTLTWSLIGCDPGGGTNGNGCGPDNCLGCCDPVTDICQDGALPTACGMNGNICLACTGGYSCNAMTRSCEPGSTGSCSPQTCMGGCCSAAGVCIKPGNYPSACGIDGMACKTCLGSQQCVGGQCQGYDPMGSCNATNCSGGCCLGDQCVQPPNSSQCGLNGSPCLPCQVGWTCNTQTGQCQDPSGCGDCAQKNGCCLNNICQPGNHPLYCGSGGLVCDTCDSSEVCEAQQCKPSTTTGDCNPTNCPSGCCDRDGRCHLDGFMNDQFCGLLGLSCDICQTWEECSWGSCDPKQTSCNCSAGQCCLNGQCVPGNSNTQCGTNGATCDNCSTKSPPTTCNLATYTCSAVTPPPTCSGANCADGCCNGTTCVKYASQSNALCGAGGTACQNCSTKSPPTTCNLATHMCNTVTPPPTCSSSNCADGCCNGTTCVRYASQFDTLCGTAGAACTSCSPNTCNTTNGTCTSPTAERWKICVTPFTIDCDEIDAIDGCETDGSEPAEIYILFSGTGYGVPSDSYTLPDNSGWVDVNISWCSTDSFTLAELNDFSFSIIDRDPVFHDTLAGPCNLIVTPSDIASGLFWFCGEAEGWFTFQP